MKYLKLGIVLYFILINASLLIAHGSIPQADTAIVLSEINILENNIMSFQQYSTGSINRLSEVEIDKIARINPASYLNTIPGVQLQSGTLSTNRLTIRGIGSRTPYNTNRINLFLLNIPITSNDGVSSPEEILSLQNINVSVQKGPSSALMGSGLGGTVKISPASISNQQSYLRTTLGSFNTKQISIGYRNENKTFIAANLTNSDGFRENNQFWRTQVLASGNINFKKIKLQPILYFIKGSAQIPSSLNRDDFENSPSKAASNWLAIEGYEASTKVIAGLNIEHKLTRQLEGLVTIYFKYYDGYEKRPFNTLDDQLNHHGASYQLSYTGDFLQSITLVRGSIENYNWSILKDDILEDVYLQNLSYFSFSNISYFKLFEQLNMSVANAINIHDYQYKNQQDSNFKQKQFPLIYSPRLGLNYNRKQNSFWGSIGHGYSNPSPEETLYPDGQINSNLKQETGWQYEIGYHFVNAKNTFAIEATLYYFHLKNLIVTKRLTEDQFMGINAGKTQHYGLENTILWSIFKNKKFPGHLEIRSNLSVSKNIFIEFKEEEIVYNGKNLPAIPNYQFSIQLNWIPLEQLSINITNNNFGDQYLNDNNTLKSNAYANLNLNIQKQFQFQNKKSLKLKLAINNILNEQYAAMVIPNAIGFNGASPRYFYPGIPRNTILSLQFAF